MKLELLSVGSLVIDKINGTECFGGSGANAAVDAHLLGINTALLTSVAQDSLGQLYIRHLQELGIKLYPLNSVQNASTICEFFITEDGVTIDGDWLDNGLEQTFGSEVPERDLVLSAQVVHLGTCVPSFAFSVSKMLSHKQVLSYNPGGWIETDFDYFIQTHPQANIVILNKKEMAFVQNQGYVQDPKELILRDDQTAVVTRGVEGTSLYTNNASYTLEPFLVDPVEETGAGDAFAAAFIWALLKEYPLDICARLGNLMGAIAVQKFGGQLDQNSIDIFKKEAIKHGLIRV